MKKHRIIIATPSYPPQLGGPALYAETFSRIWEKQGCDVRVVSFGSVLMLPPGIRHLVYICRLFFAMTQADVVYVFDTCSLAAPVVVLGRLLRKKVIVRVAGDFLWESYVNRTQEKILLSEFYTEPRPFTFKENTIFDLTSFVFQYAHVIVFSTQWQKDIFLNAYTIDTAKVVVIGNIYMDHTKRNIVPKERLLLSPSRDIYLKNKEGLEKAFWMVKDRFFDVTLDTSISSHTVLRERIDAAYAVLVTSLSEVSPNMVIDAVVRGVPVVATEDCGIRDILGDTVIWVNPKDPEDIARGIETLMDAKVYSEYMARMSKFSYVRSEEQVAQEFLNLI